MNYFCLPKIYQKYTPVLVYGKMLLIADKCLIREQRATGTVAYYY